MQVYSELFIRSLRLKNYSQNIIKLICILSFVEGKKSQHYIFESERGGKLTTRIVKFATHLLESGLDVMYVQKLLGHSSIKTTQNYLHLANTSLKNIVSPLD